MDAKDKKEEQLQVSILTRQVVLKMQAARDDLISSKSGIGSADIMDSKGIRYKIVAEWTGEHS